MNPSLKHKVIHFSAFASKTLSHIDYIGETIAQMSRIGKGNHIEHSSAILKPVEWQWTGL